MTLMFITYTGGALAEVAKSTGHQRELASELKDYLTGVENLSELLTRTADRCKSEDVKQVCSIRFSVARQTAV